MTDDGSVVPRLGLGTWQNTNSEECAESVETALEAGYRHVDTARYYDNEAAVGAGVARADVPREDVFVATKLWHDDLAAEDVPARARESLDRLGLKYVDLLYVHWPTDTYNPEGTLGAFADLRDDGLVRHVGVSNFTPDLLEEAREVCDAPIVANQVECHPLLPQTELREYCERRGIALVAYCPLLHGRIFEVPEVQTVAEKHGVSEARVCLAWLFEKGVAAVPKATSGEHIRDNFGALDLELDDEDLATIDGIDRRERLGDPEFAPWN
ncbi:MULTISPECIES: aldo/keto reductase [Halorussus]|uniref:aldo/keto reductase n=1 Tax=Halorussus TaxID=1070314 RepID=UPI00209F68DE|nr:aldo/keto reductase [Halorussus vallis]USZ75102.1 aldo/keto reductase [Halorussus vallis]